MNAPRRAARPLSSLALWLLASSLATGCILSGNIDLPGSRDGDTDTASDASGDSDLGLDSGADSDGYGDAAGEPCGQGGAAGASGAGGDCSTR